MTEQIYLTNLFGEEDSLESEEEIDTAYYIRFFLINHESWFSNLLTFIETVLCIFSSYFYTYQATFRNHLDKYEEYAPVLEQIYFEIELYTEIAFAFFMARTFITTYTLDGSTKQVKNPKLIAIRYITGSFFFDLVCLAPVTLFFLDYIWFMKYLYLVKSLRILKGLKRMNPSQLMK